VSEIARVSIVMPFLNLERYLQESIESVLAQTFSSWELLLIDDGSTDSSSGIAREYAAAFPERIRYLTHENHVNRGASASRNLGFAHAAGDYIALLDGDDVWMPHKLQEQVALLDATPEAGALYGETLLWYSWTGNAEDRRRDRIQPLGVRPDRLLMPPELLVLSLRGKAPLPSCSSIIMRRAAVAATGGFEEEFRRVYTDQAFYAKLLLETPVLVAGICWDRYRQHSDSSIQQATLAGDVHPDLPHPARRRYLEWLEGHLAGRGLQGSEVWRALQQQLWLYEHPRLHAALGWSRLLPDYIRRIYWKGAVPAAFHVGRVIMPARFRRWLWSRWLSERF
jgi:glycosyltransferase involved in cell wall biosynthesis